jgi:hypothetical protein
MTEPKRPPVALLVFGLLLITLVGVLLIVPAFKCPVCATVAERIEADFRGNPNFSKLVDYARYTMPCGYCDQRRRVTLPVWYQAKYRR